MPLIIVCVRGWGEGYGSSTVGYWGRGGGGYLFNATLGCVGCAVQKVKSAIGA